MTLSAGVASDAASPVAGRTFVCSACGARVAANELAARAFHCPAFGSAGDGDHVLEPVPDVAAPSVPAPVAVTAETNPFVRYRARSTAWHVALASGWTDEAFVALARDLDATVAAVDGRGFRTTPLVGADALSRTLGFGASGGVWVKDETGNVSGSHKARHLMGLMLYLAVLERSGGANGAEPGARLAIASCGNAALAAAVVARAADRPLDVFVPPSANPAVIDRLHRLGAHVVICDRREGERGDPCYLRFHEAIAGGALAFCTQGTDNALTIEGGETIVWELIDQAGERTFDRVFFQTGGGAFASACGRAFLAAARARMTSLPRLHAVQTAGCFPLARAWARVALRALDGLLLDGMGFDTPVPAEIRVAGEGRVHAAVLSLADARGDDDASIAAALAADPLALQACADGLRGEIGAAAAEVALADASRQRSSFMWPWEREPHSLAHGILDDETYDWRSVVRGMLASGGWPVVVDESHVADANRIGRETTGIDVDHTGSAGLAGLMTLLAAGGRDGARPVILPTEHIALIFSGIRRH